MTTMLTSNVQPRVLGLSSAQRLWLGIFLSAFSGILLLLAFPPYGIWPLAWVGYVPGVIAQYRFLPRKWSAFGPALTLLFWLGPYLSRLFGPEFGPFFQFLGVWIAIIAFFVSTERRFHELTGYRWLVLQGLAGVVGMEMVRVTFIPIVATTGFIGYTQAKQSWMLQPLSIFGIFGFDLVIVLVNYALAQAAIFLCDRISSPVEFPAVQARQTRRWLTAAGCVLAAWIGLSVILLNLQPADMAKVRVASLRPDYPTPAHQDKVNTSQVRMETFTAQAREAAAQGAQIIFTPEMMFNFDPQLEYTQQLRALAAETGAYLFISYSVSQEGETWRNEAVMLSPSGEFSAAYGKYHTWGIGERPTPSAGSFPVFETPLGRLATLICHDGNYTDVARKLSANGAQIIAAPYREFGGFGEQAWTNTLFRAVENHVAVVMSGVATVSSIINPDGSIVALDSDIQGSRTILVGDVTLGSGKTIYTAVGDILGWVSLAGLVFFIVFQGIVQTRAKKAGRGS